MTDEPNGRWTIDRKIPLALIITLAIQSGVFIWWAAGIDFRVTQLEKGDALRAPQGERIIRLETKVDSVYDRLSEIKGLLTPTPVIPQRR